MAIANAASRNIAAKLPKRVRWDSQAQASVATPEARGQEASSEYESFDDDDVERNADMYIFNYEVARR